MQILPVLCVWFFSVVFSAHNSLIFNQFQCFLLRSIHLTCWIFYWNDRVCSGMLWLFTLRYFPSARMQWQYESERIFRTKLPQCHLQTTSFKIPFQEITSSKFWTSVVSWAKRFLWTLFYARIYLEFGYIRGPIVVKWLGSIVWRAALHLLT